MIKLCNITLAYAERELLADVSAQFESGKLYSLIGRNGAGKSTLLRALAGLECSTVRSGKIEVAGYDITQLSPMQRARTVSVVTTDKCRIANLPVEDAVALGRAPYTNWIGRIQNDDRLLVHKALEMVGMEAFAKKSMDSLSDGEAQRVMIARALAQQTPVILLDEPTAFLDMPARYELCSLLNRLTHEEGKCIIFSTHELDIALSRCDATAIISTPQLHVQRGSELLRSPLIEQFFGGVDVAGEMEKLAATFKKEC